MLDNVIPKINPGDNIVIGLGDSFTQGVGSWSRETYKEHNGYIDPLKITDQLELEMYEYSWVNQLCRNHLHNYKPINLGKAGKGNRASVKELYLNPQIEFNNANDVIVVLMLSGIERFDFINREFGGHHFIAMWPNPWDKNSTHKQLWEAYARDLWSEKFVCLEALLNIREADMFCKANGWKFVVASAFDQRVTREHFITHCGPENAQLIDTIPWDKFLYPAGHKSFIELLLNYDGHPELVDGGFYEYYSKLPYPTELITNCMHPTREGYRIMADEIHKHCISRGYV